MSFSRTPNKFTDVKPKYTIPMKPHPKTGNPHYVLEGTLKETFVRLYPKTTNPEMMKLFGISHTTVARFARRLGLEKNMKVIRRKQIKAAKKTCEANGYYASLRGKAPSQACLDAYKRKCKEENYHPLKSLKSTNPRRYKKLLKQRSEKRNDLVRRERLRMEYGMPRLTHMKLREQPISRRAYQQKYLMIKEHNYFADPDDILCVCYDSQTTRSLRMEATARRHGLTVVEGDEDTETENKENI